MTILMAFLFFKGKVLVCCWGGKYIEDLGRE